MSIQTLAAAYHRIADASDALNHRLRKFEELHGTTGSYPPGYDVANQEWEGTLDKKWTVFDLVLEADVSTLADLQHKARVIEREFVGTEADCPYCDAPLTTERLKRLIADIALLSPGTPVENEKANAKAA